MVAYNTTVTVYDTDNTSLLANAKVLISDTTNHNKTAVKLSNGSGVVTYDLSTELDGFAVGDVIHTIVYKGTDSGYDRHVTAGGDGGSYSPTLYMNPVRAEEALTTRVMELSASNEAGSAADVSLYDKNDTFKFKARIPANNNGYFHWRKGLPCSGFVVIRSANSLIVTVNIK